MSRRPDLAAGPVIDVDAARRPPSGGSGWTVAVAAAVVLFAGVLLAMGAGDRMAENRVAGPLPAPASATPPASVPIDRSPEILAQAEGAVVELVSRVNKGDSIRVAEMLAPAVPAPGLGSAQWPLLRDELGWWRGRTEGAELDLAAITNFVRYFRTVPGGVLVDSCEPRFSNLDRAWVVVECGYSAFGGIRGLMGDGGEPEIGVMRMTVADGLVIDARRSPELGDTAWTVLGHWVAQSDPEAFEEAFGTFESGVVIQPVYTAQAALYHAEAAIAFARAIGARTIPLG